MGKHGRPVIERVRERINVTENGCWEWCRPSKDGYGRFSVDAQTYILVHRWMFEHVLGPVPEGMQLDHLCRNRACCNPDHLEPVTPLENVWRGNTNATKTHCPQGHEYTSENTSLARNRRGYVSRSCRECARIRRAARREMKAAA